MHWFPFSLFASICFASVNHLDKYLLSKYFKARTIGALLLFSAFVGVPTCFLISIIHPHVFGITFTSALILTANGALYLFGLLPYFYALDKDETSIVAPLFQMVSVFSALFGALFLSENLQGVQWFGCLLILIGGIWISLDTTSISSIKIKYDVLMLMILASAIMAFNGLIFKSTALHLDFWTAMFWEYCGYISFAVIVYISIPAFRREFLRVLIKNNGRIIGINVLNEILAIVGKSAQHFATMLTPLAIAYFVHEGAQPFFVLLIGIVLTVFFPSISKENISKSVLTQKILSTAVMVLGVYFIS